MKMESPIAANRFGLGARPGELERVDKDPVGWLLDQLEGPSRLASDLRDLPPSSSVWKAVTGVNPSLNNWRQTGIN